MTNQSIENDILLAEDDQDDIEIFESALQETGISYTLRHAWNGKVVMLLLQERIPQVLFIDYYMPYIDGVDCVKEIRKNKEYDHMPIIMYSGQSSADQIQKVQESGANRYLHKTNSFDELVTKLNGLLQRNWSEYVGSVPNENFVV